MKNLTISILMMGLMAYGCGDDDRGDDTGDDTGITIPDSGPTGTDMGPVTMMDMGPTGPTGMCAQPLDMLPADFFPRCSAETFSCVMGAADNAAFLACLDADTTAGYMGDASADCSTCVNYQSIYCADANGCHAEFAAVNCCIEANCGAGSADTCVQTECGTELAAFQGCEPTSECQAEIVACFDAG